MHQKISKVWLLFVVILCLWINLGSCDTSKDCAFPTFAQNVGPKAEWRGKIEDQNTRALEKLVVSGKFMTKTSHEVGGVRIDSTCVESAGDNKFLVTYEERAAPLLYICVQFVKRSNVVMQLRESIPSSRKNIGLCNDTNIVLVQWPYVRAGFTNEDSEPCPLHGGFTYMTYDRSQHSGICDVHYGQTRLESTCTVDDGMFFRFRFVRCVPRNLYMYTNQMTYCLATWYEGIYTITVLKRDFGEVLWLLRYPTNPTGTFLAYVFNDLRVELKDTGFSKERTDFIRLETKRDDPIDVNHLCYNDYEYCQEVRSPCYSRKRKVTCPVTCNMCESSAPKLTTLPSGIQGNWIDPTKKFHLPIWLNDTSLEISGVEQLHSVELPWRTNHSVEDNDQLLVTVFTNGCRPRYTCMKAVRRSESLLHIKLSGSMHWPLEQNKNQMICKDDMYAHHQSSQRLTLRKKYFTPLLSTDLQVPVNCGISSINSEYDAIFPSSGFNNNCTTNFTYIGGTTFNIVGVNCSHYAENTSYTCLASWSNGKSHDQTVVTSVTLRDSTEYFCWLFKRKRRRLDPTQILMVPFRECHEGLKRNLRAQAIIPIARYDLPPPVITTAVPSVTPHSNLTIIRNITVSDKTPGFTNPILAFIHKIMLILYLMIISLF